MIGWREKAPPGLLGKKCGAAAIDTRSDQSSFVEAVIFLCCPFPLSPFPLYWWSYLHPSIISSSRHLVSSSVSPFRAQPPQPARWSCDPKDSNSTPCSGKYEEFPTTLATRWRRAAFACACAFAFCTCTNCCLKYDGQEG